MAKKTIILSDGTKVIIRASTFGDLQKATELSEKVVSTAEGSEIIVSQAQLGWNILFLCIESICKENEEEQKPDMEWLRSISSVDYGELVGEVDDLDKAIVKEIERRGRPPAAS